MSSHIIAVPWIKKTHKLAFASMFGGQGPRPSELQAGAHKRLEQAGFKIGPGVDLTPKKG